MATKKAETAELKTSVYKLPALIDVVEEEVAAVTERMAKLKKAGLLYASEHWRKDADGEPRYLYLLYPQQPGERRRRDYVGSDTDKIEEALAKIRRGKEYDVLNARLSALKNRIRQVSSMLRDAEHCLGQ